MLILSSSNRFDERFPFQFHAETSLWKFFDFSIIYRFRIHSKITSQNNFPTNVLMKVDRKKYYFISTALVQVRLGRVT